MPKETLNLKYAPVDLSFFCHNIRNDIQGLLAVHVDYTIAAGTNYLMKYTDKSPDKFETKPTKFLSFVLAGVMINADAKGYLSEQKEYSNRMKTLT